MRPWHSLITASQLRESQLMSLHSSAQPAAVEEKEAMMSWHSSWAQLRSS
jgi:hypothetical protein